VGGAAQLGIASRLTSILHGCIKDSCNYDEATAWSHRTGLTPAA
jgi:hypothetical protein